jgi:hypothetical protein
MKSLVKWASDIGDEGAVNGGSLKKMLYYVLMLSNTGQGNGT